MQLHLKQNFLSKLIRFGQIWVKFGKKLSRRLGKIEPKFGQKWLYLCNLGQDQHLASPKTFNLLRLCLKSFLQKYSYFAFCSKFCWPQELLPYQNFSYYHINNQNILDDVTMTSLKLNDGSSCFKGVLNPNFLNLTKNREKFCL